MESNSIDSKCECCPYGFHIDLDFMRFCESIVTGAASLEKLKKLKTYSKRKPRTVFANKLTSQAISNVVTTLEQGTETNTQAAKVPSHNISDVPAVIPLPPQNLTLEISSEEEEFLTELESLYKRKPSKKPGPVPLPNTGLSETLANPTKRSKDVDPRSSKFHSLPLSGVDEWKPPQVLSRGRRIKKTNLFPMTSTMTSDHKIRVGSSNTSVNDSTSSLDISSVSSLSTDLGSPTATLDSSTASRSFTSSSTLGPKHVISLNINGSRSPSVCSETSTCTQVSQASLAGIRESMAKSLKRLRELEGQVKAVPLLQVQVSVLKEEKRLLMLQLKAQSRSSSCERSKEAVVEDDDQTTSTLTKAYRRLKNFRVSNEFISKFDVERDTGLKSYGSSIKRSHSGSALDMYQTNRYRTQSLSYNMMSPDSPKRTLPGQHVRFLSLTRDVGVGDFSLDDTHRDLLSPVSPMRRKTASYSPTACEADTTALTVDSAYSTSTDGADSNSEYGVRVPQFIRDFTVESHPSMVNSGELGNLTADGINHTDKQYPPCSITVSSKNATDIKHESVGINTTFIWPSLVSIGVNTDPITRAVINSVSVGTITDIPESVSLHQPTLNGCNNLIRISRSSNTDMLSTVDKSTYTALKPRTRDVGVGAVATMLHCNVATVSTELKSVGITCKVDVQDNSTDVMPRETMDEFTNTDFRLTRDHSTTADVSSTCNKQVQTVANLRSTATNTRRITYRDAAVSVVAETMDFACTGGTPMRDVATETPTLLSKSVGSGETMAQTVDAGMLAKQIKYEKSVNAVVCTRDERSGPNHELPQTSQLVALGADMTNTGNVNIYFKSVAVGECAVNDVLCEPCSRPARHYRTAAVGMASVTDVVCDDCQHDRALSRKLSLSRFVQPDEECSAASSPATVSSCTSQETVIAAGEYYSPPVTPSDVCVKPTSVVIRTDLQLDENGNPKEKLETESNGDMQTGTGVQLHSAELSDSESDSGSNSDDAEISSLVPSGGLSGLDSDASLSSPGIPSPYEPSAELLLSCTMLKNHYDRGAELPEEEVAFHVNKVTDEWFCLAGQQLSLCSNVGAFIATLESISATVIRVIVNRADANGNTVLHYSLSHGNYGIVNQLLCTGCVTVNAANRAGYTPAMLAALAPLADDLQRDVIREVFVASDINARASRDSQTALMLAAAHGRMDTARLLVQSGAELNLQDVDGSTALMCASEHGHLDVVKLLLTQPNVDATICDHDGQTALSIAMEAGHRDIGVLLYTRVNLSPTLNRHRRRGSGGRKLWTF